MRMYRHVEHTGDIGIEASSTTLKGLLEDLAKGLYTIFLDISNVKCINEKTIAVEGKDLEELIVEFLNEIIYLFDVEKIILAKIKEAELNKTNTFLKITFCYDIFDKSKHKVLGAGVKAATYHDIILKTSPNYYARIIVDV